VKTRRAQSITSAGDYLFVGNDYHGVRVLPADCSVVSVAAASPSANGSRLRVSPTPMRGTATIRVDLARGSEVRVDVHDAAGRQVRRVFEGSHPAGPASFRWDGRDGSGHALPTGVYFVRAMTTDGATLGSDRVVLLR